jgi:hypothetical protein
MQRDTPIYSSVNFTQQKMNEEPIDNEAKILDYQVRQDRSGSFKMKRIERKLFQTPLQFK